MPTLAELDAFEILDSRGRPTLQVEGRLRGGVRVSAQVPSGASTGSAEAHELRDGDPGRHAGRGCLLAAGSIREIIREAFVGRDFCDQAALDGELIALDGSPNKTRLGANAILGVSLMFARACANELGIPLYRHFAGLAGCPLTWIPRPTINLFSGGKHAGGQVAIQDVLIVPMAATSMREALSQACAVYQKAAELTSARYSGRSLVADEGGLAPSFPNSEAMLHDAVEAIQLAGFQPGRDVALAIDVAASHFFDGQFYVIDGTRLRRDAMVQQLEDWVNRYPVISLEDGLAEEDWTGWKGLVARLGSRVLILGDDLLCTNPARIRRAVADRAATALLLKVNQVGTLSEAAEALRLARVAGWHVTISARSGETEDDWLADLATGWNGNHVKVGSITRSERLSKYNRLLAIEHHIPMPLAPANSPAAARLM